MSDWKFRGSLVALLGGSTAAHPQCPCRSRTIAKTSEYGADPTVPLSILRFTAVFDFSGSPMKYAVDGHGNGSNAPEQATGWSASIGGRAARGFQSTTD
ncbi:hypothetical protein [Bradyrhizobium pachyrhizi]|uniref:hypothetical protein n=1 Tax=Bradyrhizobium pachyrhizi TaxID=280333 RepID=UPI003D35BE10